MEGVGVVLVVVDPTPFIKFLDDVEVASSKVQRKKAPHKITGQLGTY